MVALSEPVIALVGVAIGGVLSAATALTAPWLTSRLASRQFREELDWRRLDEVAALMDEAAIALERFHWSLRSAIDALESREDGTKRWEQHREAVTEARDLASSCGSRLAIRLGPRSESELVGIYDDFQTCYGHLAKTVLHPETNALGAGELLHQLDLRANHDRYFVAAREKRQALGEQLMTGARSPSHA
jgi:hypothetical protein